MDSPTNENQLEINEQSIIDLVVQDEMIQEVDVEDQLPIMVHEGCESPLDQDNTTIEDYSVSQSDI